MCVCVCVKSEDMCLCSKLNAEELERKRHEMMEDAR